MAPADPYRSNSFKRPNGKQMAYSARKVAWARAMVKNRFLLCMTGLFLFLLVGFALTHSDIVDLVSVIGLGGGGLHLAYMGFIGNITEVTDRFTAGNQIAYKVWLTEASQVDETQAFPSPNVNREVGTIPLKLGEFMHYFEAIDGTPKDNSAGEKTELSTDVTNTLSFAMGGDGAKLYDFIELYAGGRFIVIYQNSSTGKYSIMGSWNKPMILQGLDRKRDNEATAVTFTFQNKSFSQPYLYVGAIINTTPQILAAGATELAIVAGKSQYQLTDHTSQVTLATVSGITPDMYGKTIEVLGSGETLSPIISDNGVFIMFDDSTWIGSVGSSISFWIHDSNTLIEIPGTRKLNGVFGAYNILDYVDDFDVIYVPKSEFVIESDGALSQFSDVGNDNELKQASEARKPVFSGNTISFNATQQCEIEAADMGNFSIGINDLYVLFGVRLSKHQHTAAAACFFFGGSSNTIGGWHFWCLNSNTDSYQWWFTISDGTGSARKSYYGQLDSCLFDDQYHVIEISLDRDIGTTIYIDGVAQTPDADSTPDAVSYNIISESTFTLGAAGTNGSSNQLMNCFAFRKSLPTANQRIAYRNVLNTPLTGWALNPHFTIVTIPIIVDKEVVFYGDALCNVSIINDLGVDYSCIIGSENGNNYTINHAIATTEAFSVKIKSGNNVVENRSSTITVYDKINTGSKGILLIGDSTMTAGADDMINAFNALFDLMTWTGLGTQSAGSVNHEGHTGKTYDWFRNDAASPFTKSGALDISAYFTDNAIATPDFVYMRCGINDIFAQAGDDLTRTEMYTILSDVNDLIDGFLAFDSSLIVLIALPSICENTGAGWQANYPGSTTQNKYIELMHFFWEELIVRYSGGTYNARVDVCFGAMNLDRDTGYLKVDGIHTNGVHMNADGYEMLANGDAGTFNKHL